MGEPTAPSKIAEDSDHGHSDHAGPFAFFKQSTGAQITIMEPDVAMIARLSVLEDPPSEIRRTSCERRQPRSTAAAYLCLRGRRPPSMSGRAPATASPPSDVSWRFFMPAHSIPSGKSAFPSHQGGKVLNRKSRR